MIPLKLSFDLCFNLSSGCFEFAFTGFLILWVFVPAGSQQQNSFTDHLKGFRLQVTL